MTVISSVYKDDDVKCHTSRADPLGERPGSFCSTLHGVSLFPDMVLLVFFFLCLASSLSNYFYYSPLHSSDFSLHVAKLSAWVDILWVKKRQNPQSVSFTLCSDVKSFFGHFSLNCTFKCW